MLSTERNGGKKMIHACRQPQWIQVIQPFSSLIMNLFILPVSLRLNRISTTSKWCYYSLLTWLHMNKNVTPYYHPTKNLISKSWSGDKKWKTKPLGHSEMILSLSMATVEAVEYRNGPMSVPSYNRNLSSTKSSSGICNPLVIYIWLWNPTDGAIKSHNRPRALSPTISLPIIYIYKYK